MIRIIVVYFILF